MKTQLLSHLLEKGHEVVDMGSDSEEIVRYPYYAAQVCRALQKGECDAGILICSTGIGMSIAANKFRGIRAALCTSQVMAKMTRRHNDSNVLCLGGQISGLWETMDIVDTWVQEAYIGGRHEISLSMIAVGEGKTIHIEGWQPPRELCPDSHSDGRRD